VRGEAGALRAGVEVVVVGVVLRLGMSAAGPDGDGRVGRGGTSAAGPVWNGRAGAGGDRGAGSGGEGGAGSGGNGGGRAAVGAALDAGTSPA